MSEAQTRIKLIEKMLNSTGWTPIIKFVKGKGYSNGAVEEYWTNNGPADYILFHDGQALAAVEAKKVSLGPQNVLVQAQRYSKGFEEGNLRFNEYRIPFVYSTNGKVIWFQDLMAKDSRSRKVSKFHQLP